MPYADKLGHALLIGGLGFFLDGALYYRRIAAGLAFPRLGPAIVLVAAGVEEYLQRLSPRRSSDIRDFAADVVGVCFFAWLAKRVSGAGAQGALTRRSSGASVVEVTSRGPAP